MPRVRKSSRSRVLRNQISRAKGMASRYPDSMTVRSRLRRPAKSMPVPVTTLTEGMPAVPAARVPKMFGLAV